MLLALETSCDETSAAVVDPEGTIVSHTVASQHEIHEKYKGIVPELASRRHCEVINVILKETLEEAQIGWEALRGVAVTHGPGLVGSLLVGITGAKAISFRFELPLIPVNHIEAHAYSVEIDHNIDYPYISLVASGGHTVILLVNSSQDFEVLGGTRDDAAGEAFDKVAKMLDLGYPGGPEIERLAGEGNPEAIDFPRPTLTGSGRWNWRIDDYDFSFSGLKTAVYYYLSEHPEADSADVAASFQRALNDCLVYKTVEAAREHEVNQVALGGGVVANQTLRDCFEKQAAKHNLELFSPSFEYCTDNAAMIGFRAQQVEATAGPELNAEPNLSLTEQ